MPEERQKKVGVVVGGESSRRLDGSGAGPDVGVPLNDQFPPDLPIVHEVVVSEEVRRRVEDEEREADDESEIISVGGPLSIVGGCESEGAALKKQLGELVSFQRQRLP